MISAAVFTRVLNFASVAGMTLGRDGRNSLVYGRFMNRPKVAFDSMARTTGGHGGLPLGDVFKPTKHRMTAIFPPGSVKFLTINKFCQKNLPCRPKNFFGLGHFAGLKTTSAKLQRINAQYNVERDVLIAPLL